MNEEYYIVEHPHRGVVMEQLTPTFLQAKKLRFRCSYMANRTDGIHMTLEQAQKVVKHLRGSFILRVQTKPKFSITYLDGRQA